MRKSELRDKAEELGLDLTGKESKKDLQALISNREAADEASSEASQPNEGETPEEKETRENDEPEQVKTTNTGAEPFEPNIEGYSYGSAPDTEYPHELPSNHPEGSNPEDTDTGPRKEEE